MTGEITKYVVLVVIIVEYHILPMKFDRNICPEMWSERLEWWRSINVSDSELVMDSDQLVIVMMGSHCHLCK